MKNDKETNPIQYDYHNETTPEKRVPIQILKDGDGDLIVLSNDHTLWYSTWRRGICEWKRFPDLPQPGVEVSNKKPGLLDE